MLDCEVPSFSVCRDNRLVDQARVKTLHEPFAATLDESLKGTKSRRTDVLGALSAAEVVFNQDSRQRMLVLLSDMLEDSEAGAFEKSQTTDQSDRAIIAKASAEKRLPSWAGGALRRRRLRPRYAKAWEVERFWLAYAKTVNAHLSREHYGPALKNFGE